MPNRLSLSLERMRAINCVRMVAGKDQHVPIDHGADVRTVEWVTGPATLVKLTSPGYDIVALFVGGGPRNAHVYLPRKIVLGDSAGRLDWVAVYQIERESERDRWRVGSKSQQDLTPRFKKLFRV
jgi:hypothetical protein